MDDSPTLRTIRAAARDAWTTSGGPTPTAAIAHLYEAHELQLSLLALQHEISQQSGASAAAASSSSATETEAELMDEEVEAHAAQPFEGRQLLDGGGFRQARPGFATADECAQLRAAATLAMAQSFRRGGQTTLSIAPELCERWAGCGAASAVPTLAAVMRRMQEAATEALGGAAALHFCGALLIRLVPPSDAAAAAPACWPLPPRQARLQSPPLLTDLAL